ncbi:MAG: hypothetical protein KF770_05260 [Anaerolineae bacterium]|nr:hypothetical protein [Anaerolineae bacterium]
MPEYFITAHLVLESALHIGSGKGGDPTDAPIRRARDGRLLIPGTAVAGSLRSAATRLAPRLGFDRCQALDRQDYKKPCGCPVCQVFGDVNPMEKPTPEPDDWIEAIASRLWIQDAFAEAIVPTFVRDGVGIDHKSGHASQHVKFDYEVIPRHTAFILTMRLAYNLGESKQQLVDKATEQKIWMLLTAVLTEWEQGRGQLGGNIARGLGRFTLEKLTCSQPELKTPAQLIDYLKAMNRADVSKPLKDWPEEWLQKARQAVEKQKESDRFQTIASCFVTVKFTLKFTDFFLQNDPLVAFITGFDHAPLVEKLTDDGLGNPVLAGSSLRGVLRSQAGKIIRTLYTAYCLDNASDPTQTFLLNCPSCDVLEDNDGAAIASCYSRLNLDREEERLHEWQEADFCLTCQLFGNQERGSRLWIRDAVWSKPDEATWQAQDFLAIDRFTGGGLDGAKFDAAPLTMAEFETAVTLHNPAEWELGLLALLLRDLADKRLTLGFGAAKGYGRVQATDFIWEIGYLHKDDLAENGRDLWPPLTPQASGIYQLAQYTPPAWLPDDWQDHAAKWVEQFNDKVESFRQSKYVRQLAQDSFFGTDVERLYGRSRTEVNIHE